MRTLRAVGSLLALGTMLVALAARADAAHPEVRTEHNCVELAPQTTTAAPGSTLYIALRQRIAPGWHTYWRNPGDAGQPTSLAWTLPSGWRAGDIVWPAPERDLTGPIMNYVLTGEVYLPTPITVPVTARPGSTVMLKAAVSWLVCKDVCIPEDATLTLNLPVTAGTPGLDAHSGAPIQQTLTAAPKPAGLTARFHLQGDTLKLAVVGAAVRGAGVGQAYFYPYNGAVIDQAKPQMAERGREGLTLTIPAGYAFTHGKAPTTLSGVLSLGASAYEVSAALGPPPAGAIGLTPPAITTEAPKVAGSGGAGGMGALGAIGLAFLGGLVLNLMPCVFPVLSMKAVAIARHVQSPERARGEGIAFFVGVVASFVILAAVLIAARAGGQAVGWGFQLQSPAVVAALALVMFAAGLNLSGVFEVGLSAQGVGSSLAGRQGWVGAVFTGVLAVVVAAPCTAPFMAPAIGWALVQPPGVALAVFAALGVGLAAPFTALAFAPGLFRLLPPPGGWMEGLRKTLAFPMYGAAAWLAWVFALQAGLTALPFLFAAALALAFAGWMFGVGQRAGMANRPRLVPGAVAFIALIATVGLVGVGAQMTAPEAVNAGTVAGASANGLPIQPWSPERVAALQASGRPVFVDFTAAWCVTCQVNERTALATRQVADAFARTGAVYLKADWTRRDARIADALTERGRSGVPLYLVYGKSAEPQILPQLLTSGLVAGALDAAKS